MLNYENTQKAKKYLKFIFINPFKYAFLKIYFGFLIALNLAIWGLANFTYKQVAPGNIALHYSVDFGIDFYGPANKIFIIPVLATFFLLLNFSATFIMRLYLRDDFKFIAHILLSAAIVISIILLGAVISIYLVNFR